MSWAFSAHRAVVDVDLYLGLVKVVQMATTQDTGTIINPLQVVGQIEGGTAQGVGLAVMEEIVLDKGRVRNPSFTDYLIPTALDMPDVVVAGLVTDPERQTCWSANDGMNFDTGSLSSKAPSSQSIIAATEVIGLVIE